jgi:hypothetical protein
VVDFDIRGVETLGSVTSRPRFGKNQIEVFWVVTPCSVVVAYQRFGGPCCLHLQSEVIRKLHLGSICANFIKELDANKGMHEDMCNQ